MRLLSIALLAVIAPYSVSGFAFGMVLAAAFFAAAIVAVRTSGMNERPISP